MKVLGMALSILLLFFQCSYAAITMYTDRNAWRSAAGGSQVFFVDFNTYTTDVAASAPLNVGPFTLTPNGSTWDMPLIESAQGGFANTSFDGTAGVTMRATFGRSLSVNFQSSVGSFGFDLADSFGDGRMARITTSTGDFHDFVAHPGTNGFIGLVSTAPITSLTFSTTSNVRPLIDNFEANSAVPEPSAASLLVLGAGVLAVIRRRKKD